MTTDEHCFIMVDSIENAQKLLDYIRNDLGLNLHSLAYDGDNPIYQQYGEHIDTAYGFEISKDASRTNPKKDDYAYAYRDIGKITLDRYRNDDTGYFYFYETEFDNIIKPILNRRFNTPPSYKPRTFIRESKTHDFIVRCRNRKDCVDFENILHNMEWTYSSGAKYLVRENTYDDLSFYGFNEKDKKFSAGVGDSTDDFYKNDVVYEYPENKGMIFRQLIPTPSYDKKKFIRESIDTMNIGVSCNDRESCVDFEQFLHDNDWLYDNGSMYLVRDGSWHDLLYVKFNKDDKTFTAVPGSIYEESTIIYNYPEDIKEINKLVVKSPSYEPKKFIRESKELKVLNAFDMDDTLVYGKHFEEYIKPMLVREYLTPEIILNNKLDDIGVGIEQLKYENGRIYFDDPHQDYEIPQGSSWVRKKNRVYIIQPDVFFMTEESMPIGVHEDILKLYNDAEYRCIITARNERIKRQTVKVLEKLGLKKPNMGLFMYPANSFSYTWEYKSNKLIELQNIHNFDRINYYDDNIKLLKRMKKNLEDKGLPITFYKVTKNRYRQI